MAGEKGEELLHIFVVTQDGHEKPVRVGALFWEKAVDEVWLRTVAEARFLHLVLPWRW